MSRQEKPARNVRVHEETYQILRRIAFEKEIKITDTIDLAVQEYTQHHEQK